MRRIQGINRKAARIEARLEELRKRPPAGVGSGGAGPASDDPEPEVVALRSEPGEGPHIPLGCTLIFSPGWEADSGGSTAGLCQPVERDLFDCHLGCFWPAQVPDQMNHAPDWTGRCAAAQKDWRNIDLIFP